jgi:hypothetical protein
MLHWTMERDHEMSLAYDQQLTTVAGPQERPGIDQEDSGLNIAVIFTSVNATIAALKRAGWLAESLGARITLLVPQVVPYALPLTSPPVLLEFQENRFREIAKESPVEIRVQLYLCRDSLETLKAVLNPRSLIVVGGRKRFWPRREKNLVRSLRRASYEVIFTEME